MHAYIICVYLNCSTRTCIGKQVVPQKYRHYVLHLGLGFSSGGLGGAARKHRLDQCFEDVLCSIVA